MKFHSMYKGCEIWNMRAPGYQLPWGAYCSDHFIYADTLAGIRRLITRELSQPKGGTNDRISQHV